MLTDQYTQEQSLSLAIQILTTHKMCSIHTAEKETLGVHISNLLDIRFHIMKLYCEEKNIGQT
jgi:hypothetical protein